MALSISLENKIALITGAGRGIGRAIATTMAKAGADVLVNDLRAENCDQTAASVRESGRKAVIVEGDISNENDVRDFVQKGISNFGKIDILVNNAGVVGRKSIFDTTEKEWDQLLDVNLKGNFLCSKHVAETMKDQGVKGRIVNISSIMGEVALPPRPAYCASKGGIIALTRDLAAELAQYEINVNSVAPGWVETDLTASYFAQKNVHDYLIERIPLGRFCMPEEIANVVCFISSEYGRYITGQTIFVDGGWTAI
jgi:NAD(P)-dependent dehydrogenase (short-subunit alcohol dehydrogenase family)